MTNPPPLLFGFLSELVSIHFPGGTGPTPSLKYDLDISVICTGAAIPSPQIYVELSGTSAKTIVNVAAVNSISGAFSTSFPILKEITGSPIITLWVDQGATGGTGFTVGGPTDHLLKILVIATPHGKAPPGQPPYQPINNPVFPWWASAGFIPNRWANVGIDISLAFNTGTADWGTQGLGGSDTGPPG
jgi:hypothetical protein